MFDVGGPEVLPCIFPHCAFSMGKTGPSDFSTLENDRYLDLKAKSVSRGLVHTKKQKQKQKQNKTNKKKAKKQNKTTNKQKTKKPSWL